MQEVHQALAAGAVTLHSKIVSRVPQTDEEGNTYMPIGDPHSIQSLVKLTKREDGTLEREDLGAVRFVPLIGEHGFSN